MSCAVELLRCGTRYWLLDRGHARREVRSWRRRARRIPDPLLRRLALEKLTVEKLNPEAAVLFAATAPARGRAQLVALIVAYQVLYDYLDSVNEQPASTELTNGLCLHAALVDAVRPGQRRRDYYLRNPVGDDGGYAAELTLFCQRTIAGLPSLARVAPVLERAAARCGEAQSHNHALAIRDERAFVAWCEANAPGSDYRWWELAAAGISCLGIHALFALAANPRSGLADAVATDRAYFPPVCAISALLDSLADHAGDAGTDNHSFVGHYASSEDASCRFTAITTEAVALQRGLRERRRHGIILSGIVAFYLSSPTVDSGFPRPVARCLVDSAGLTARVMRAVMRLRRRVA